MTQNSIKIKAETVEEAVQTALNILHCTIEDIDIQVITPPSKSLFGLRKNLAEVKITKRVIHTSPINQNNESKSSVLETRVSDTELDELIDSVFDSNIMEQMHEPISAPVSSTNDSNHQTNEIQFGAWIQNNKVYVKDHRERLPIIEAEANIKVFVNGEKLVKPKLVTSKDHIELIVEDEVIPSVFWVDIKDANMMATLTIKPGIKITRIIEDTEPQERLIIKAKEIVTNFNDIKMEDIMEKLHAFHINNGILTANILNLLKIGQGEAIIAKGIPTKEGLDGDIDVLIEGWEKTENENVVENPLKKVDFREARSFPAVEVGQVIAEKIDAIAGAPGKDLFGNIVPSNHVQDVVLRMGKNVELNGNRIVALVAGRPHIESRGKLVKIDVMKEYIHGGDVGLDSGNIRFPGDIRIIGDVLDSMRVDSEGCVTIKGTVNHATIHSLHSLYIEKNVFSSDLSAGKVNNTIASLVHILSDLLIYLDNIIAAVNQVMIARYKENPKEEFVRMSYVLRLLLEKKYGDFKRLIRRFTKLVEESETVLDEEWKLLSNQLNEYFMTVSQEQNIQLQSLEEFVEWMKEMYESYAPHPEPKVTLNLPYSINSSLYSSGNINVTGEGLYHCNLQADHNIYVKGTCRGGRLRAGNEIFLNDVGSENGGKTVVIVPQHGKIHIKYAHAETVIQVGKRMHMFKKGATNIVASLDEEQNLKLF